MVKLVGMVLKKRSERAERASSVLVEYLTSRGIDYFILYSAEGSLNRDVEKKIARCDIAHSQ